MKEWILVYRKIQPGAFVGDLTQRRQNNSILSILDFENVAKNISHLKPWPFWTIPLFPCISSVPRSWCSNASWSWRRCVLNTDMLRSDIADKVLLLLCLSTMKVRKFNRRRFVVWYAAHRVHVVLEKCSHLFLLTNKTLVAFWWMYCILSKLEQIEACVHKRF